MPPLPTATKVDGNAIVQTYRWGSFGAAYEKSLPSALEVCADGYEAWGRYNPRESIWTDRRPIGAFFGCPDAATSATKPQRLVQGS